MAMTPETIARYGDELYDSLISCVPVEPLTNREPDITIEDAYHIQLRMIQRRLDAGEIVVGKKIGVRQGEDHEPVLQQRQKAEAGQE